MVVAINSFSSLKFYIHFKNLFKVLHIISSVNLFVLESKDFSFVGLPHELCNSCPRRLCNSCL